MDRTRLLLIDDHILFREGLSRLLASEPDFEIIGGCGTAAEALEVLKQTTVDVVLLDFDLGEEHASQFISSARRQGFEGKILVVTAGMNANESSVAIQLGASGIFLKHNSPATLTRAIRMVVGGEAWVDEKVMRLLAAAVDENDDQSSAKALTTR
jgi:DNA-binding NarL/FixJ family response regulator